MFNIKFAAMNYLQKFKSGDLDTVSKTLYPLLALLLVFLAFRSGTSNGDFAGYIRAGQDTLDGLHIYWPYTNTWPPVFSIFSIPLALLDQLSSYWLRVFWSLGSLLTFVGTIKYSLKLSQSVFKLKWEMGLFPSLKRWEIIIPLLIMLKYLMDNVTNLQINLYFLFLTVYALYLFTQNKLIPAALLIAITITFKIYTIFFLFYFLFKREWKLSLYTILFIGLLNGISFIYWGYELASEYYSYWFNEVVDRSDFSEHKNQSIFGMFYRWLTSLELGHNMLINIVDLPPKLVRKITYLAVAFASIYPAIKLYKPLKDKSSLSSLLEYALIFACVPILSPISWKAYFIFLWFPFFLLYQLLFVWSNSLKHKTLIRLKAVYYISIVLLVFSSEIFTGSNFSDVLEVYSTITVGAILVVGLLFYLRLKVDYFQKLAKT